MNGYVNFLFMLICLSLGMHLVERAQSFGTVATGFMFVIASYAIWHFWP